MTEYTPSPEAIEAAARALAYLESGEDCPTNEALGGSLTGTRDDEFRDGVREDATQALIAAGPIIEQAVREQIAADIQRVRNEPWLVDCDARYAGYYTGVRAGMESAASIARGEET